MKLNNIKRVMIVSWFILFIYLSANLILGSHAQPKEFADELQRQELSLAEYQVAFEEYNSLKITKARDFMIPFWRYNRYIYPVLFFTALCITYLYINACRRQKPSNKSLKHGTAQSAAP